MIPIEYMNKFDQDLLNTIILMNAEGIPTKQKRLAEQLCASPRTVRRAIRRLEKVEKIRTVNNGMYGNTYKVIDDSS